jgi:hypothetical protein
MTFTNNGGAIGATPTTITNPGKFYFGVNTEKLTTNGVLLSGISTKVPLFLYAFNLELLLRMVTMSVYLPFMMRFWRFLL